MPTPSKIMMLIFLSVSVIAFAAILFKTLKNKLAPVKTVEAVVVGKNKIETFSKYSGTGKKYHYAIVFEAEGKKRSFYVSEFSYGGYQKGERGTLKYKGERLIDFS